MSHFIFYTLYYFSVQVVDNHRISVTLRESVFMAQELALQGMSAKEIKTYLEEDTYHFSYKKIRGNMKKALGGFYTKDITAIVEDLYQVTKHIKFIE